MSNTKKLLSNSFLYTLSGILTKCISFILLPIYTYFLSTSDYGITNMLNSFNSVATYFILLSLDSALIRYYAEYKDNKKTLKKLYGTILLFTCIVLLFFLSVLILFRKWFTPLFFKGIPFFPYVLISLGTLSLSSLYTLHRRFLEASQQGKKLTIIGLIGVILTALFTLLLIGVFKLGATGVLLATWIVNILYLIYMIIDIYKNKLVIICLDFSLLIKVLRYSLPLVPHNMSGYIANFFSRIVLNINSGLTTVGLFSIATQITSVIETFQDSVGHAYRPWLNETLKENSIDLNEKIENISSSLLVGYSIIYLLVALFCFEVIYIMTPSDFLPAWKVIPLLVIGYSLNSIYYFYIYQCFYYFDTSKKIFIISIMGNVTGIIVTFITVPLIGIYGNALAVFASAMVMCFCLIRLANTHPKIGYNLNKMCKILISVWIFIIIGVAPAYVYNQSSFSFIIILYKLIIFMIYIIFLYLTNKSLFKKIGLFKLIEKRIRRMK